MKTIMLLLGLASAMVADAADMRVWTSRKGTSIEAKLSGVKDGKVVLLTSEPKEIEVKIDDLSLADRQHLVEYADQPKEILTTIELGVPEEEVRLDKSQFKKLDEKLVFDEDTELSFDLMESDHFLVATAGKARPNAVAEMAERLWHGMAFQHMNFRQDWGDKKQVIFLIEDEDLYSELGKWYIKFLRSQGDDDNAKRMEQLWDKVSGTTVALTNDVQEKYNVYGAGRVMRIQDSVSRSFKKVFGPFPTHVLAGMLLNKQMGGVSDISPAGYFALITGHAYYKEIQLAEKSETQMIDATGTEASEISDARGFEDGTSWAKTLRKLVRGGKVKLNFEQMLTWEVETLNPERLVSIYSFAYYVNSTPARVSSFAELVRRVESNKQVPAAIEIARIFGFTSVEELQADWVKFVESSDFK